MSSQLFAQLNGINVISYYAREWRYTDCANPSSCASFTFTIPFVCLLTHLVLQVFERECFLVSPLTVQKLAGSDGMRSS
jgi:hypothetical protein